MGNAWFLQGKMASKTLTALLAGALALNVAGCSGNPSDWSPEKMGKFEGYEVRIGVKGGKRYIGLSENLEQWKRHSSKASYLHANDFNNDERFDEILLDSLPKGHPLERYANPETLEKAYQAVLDQNKEK